MFKPRYFFFFFLGRQKLLHLNLSEFPPLHTASVSFFRKKYIQCTNLHNTTLKRVWVSGQLSIRCHVGHLFPISIEVADVLNDINSPIYSAKNARLNT
jgi:hypothetical protein